MHLLLLFSIRYEIYSSLDTTTSNLKFEFNATASTKKATISALTPGTTYYFRIKPFTKAGGTLGDAAQARTFESAPEGVPAPKVAPYNATAVVVTIYPPKAPNGVITKYVLVQDGVETMEMSNPPSKNGYVISGLMPYSKHTFQVKVCTEKGCGYSDVVTSFTRHGIPQGSIVLSVTGIESRSINASWTAIATPNGPITYRVLMKGEFYSQPGVNYDTVNTTVECYSGGITHAQYICMGLLPKAVYYVRVNGSNDVGFVLSNQVKVLTKPDGNFLLVKLIR